MAKIYTNICEKCGGGVEVRQEGSSQALYCTKCDWAIVTTCIPEILKDVTIYHLHIINGNQNDLSHIKIVASISGFNFLNTKKLLYSASPIVFSGKAIDISKAKKQLEQIGLITETTPQFKW